MQLLKNKHLKLILSVSNAAFFILSSGIPAHAFTPKFDLGFENHLSRSTVDPAEFPIVSFGTTFNTDNDELLNTSDVEYHGDLHFKISPTHPKAYALSSKNFYFGEKDQSESSPLRFSYGRRLINWSKIDELWQLGAFEPLDSWDRLRSFSQGLTGVFAYTETRHFNYRAFFSYLFMPEVSPNIVVEDDQFVNAHPQAISTVPQSFNLLNRPTPLGYHLDIPPISKIIFRPSVAFMIETKHEYPVNVKFAYGFMPLNYFPVALQASLAIPIDQIVVELKPRLINHSLYNGEIAFEASDSWNLGFTVLVDQPMADAFPADYTTTPLSTAYHLSPWAQFQAGSFKLLVTQLWTAGGLDADVGPYANPGQSVFSSRLLYRNATQVAIRSDLADPSPHHPTLQLKYVHDYSVLADWIAADFFYSIEPHLFFVIGGDIISARRDVSPDRGAEFLADMRAIDRVRLGVNYAF
ncbi:MAG: hypothetical protein H7333_07790 [Bdellovibrionales bacterium]|nr:hypothetical protein [Oligoflexia bacterium]